MAKKKKREEEREEESEDWQKIQMIFWMIIGGVKVGSKEKKEEIT